MFPQKGILKMKAVTKSPRKSSVAPQAEIEKRPFIPDPPMLPSDTEDAELTETDLDDQESVLPSSATESELGDEEDDDDAYSDDDEACPDEHEDDDWSTKTPKAKQSRSIVPVSPSVEHAQLKARSQAGPKASTNQFRDAKLAKYMDNLNLEDGAANDSTKKGYHEPSDVDDDEEGFDLPVVKKKKRSVLILRVVSTFTLINYYSQLGKNPIITEEGINKMAYTVETSVPKRLSIRRFVM